MWIQDMTYRGVEPKRVFQGVENAIHYAEELGFASDSLPIKDLMEIG